MSEISAGRSGSLALLKIVGLPNAPYISMNPNGQTADGSTTYKITGYLPEVLDNLKVSYARK